MPVEEIKSVNYYSLNDGRVTATNGPHKGTQYESIWGVLVGIEHVKDEYQGETIYKWHFKLESPNHDQLEILQVGEKASAARGIISSLLMIPRDTIKMVHLRPYVTPAQESGREFTNVWVQWADDTGEAWKDVEWNQEIIDAIPSAKEIKLDNGRVVYDDGERILFVRKMAARIKKQRIVQASESEKVDGNTGEVFDGKKQAETAYGDPAPEKVKQQSTSEVDQHMHHNNFDDLDDDLPF